MGHLKNKDVYRIDLSMVISKYIGETEKNLEGLFSVAENKDWILFFDEADALFSKRTGVRDSHDKYANQEVSYLLQRVEDYNGLVILASNMKVNIDDAFTRRFNSQVKFSFPTKENRGQIWNKVLPEPFKELSAVLSSYELSGGNINNALQYGLLKLVEREGSDVLKPRGDAAEVASDTPTTAISPDVIQLRKRFLKDIEEGTRKEINKEGKPFVAVNHPQVTSILH